MKIIIDDLLNYSRIILRDKENKTKTERELCTLIVAKMKEQTKNYHDREIQHMLIECDVRLDCHAGNKNSVAVDIMIWPRGGDDPYPIIVEVKLLNEIKFKNRGFDVCHEHAKYYVKESYRSRGKHETCTSLIIPSYKKVKLLLLNLVRYPSSVFEDKPMVQLWDLDYTSPAGSIIINNDEYRNDGTPAEGKRRSLKRAKTK